MITLRFMANLLISQRDIGRTRGGARRCRRFASATTVGGVRGMRSRVAICWLRVTKCKIMHRLKALVGLWPIIDCYSWTLVTASWAPVIFTLATTGKQSTSPKQSADFRPWSFGTGDEKSNIGTAYRRLNETANPCKGPWREVRRP